MVRGIGAVALALGHGNEDGGSYLRPDEDEFTLIVEVIEELLHSLPRPAGPSPRLVLLGGAVYVEDWMLREATGFGDLEIERSDGSISDLAKGVRRAIGEGADDANDHLFIVTGSAKRGDAPTGTVGLRFTSEGALLLDRWTDRGASSEALLLPLFIDGLRELRRWTESARPGDETDWWLHRGPTGDVSARVTLRGPIAWAGAWDERQEHSGGVQALSGRTNEAVSLDKVSQGAYVPWTTYRENLPSRWRLEATRCLACLRVSFPRREFCRWCGETRRLETVLLPRDGLTVVASTVIQSGAQPTEFDDLVSATGGYGVVLVEMVPGVRATFQVTDHEAVPLSVGARVDTRLRRLYAMEGQWRYGRKAVPRTELK
ncbi:MAG: hypothetical protein WCA77_02320 [Thermoplasmata archaeon]